LQENEGAPQAVINIDSNYRAALSGLKIGDRIILFTWLHMANRGILITKPRNNPDAENAGVFVTRSPDRPNPIGIHVAEVIEITENGELKVSNLEVLDGTPLIDIKPYL
jgi:tRNA-Thr(GGU) m(6)t(6)A37 methyltransferase TsaA